MIGSAEGVVGWEGVMVGNEDAYVRWGSLEEDGALCLGTTLDIATVAAGAVAALGSVVLAAHDDWKGVKEVADG